MVSCRRSRSSRPIAGAFLPQRRDYRLFSKIQAWRAGGGRTGRAVSVIVGERRGTMKTQTGQRFTLREVRSRWRACHHPVDQPYGAPKSGQPCASPRHAPRQFGIHKGLAIGELMRQAALRSMRCQHRHSSGLGGFSRCAALVILVFALLAIMVDVVAVPYFRSRGAGLVASLFLGASISAFGAWFLVYLGYQVRDYFRKR